jgi:hypothetical protein
MAHKLKIRINFYRRLLKKRRYEQLLRNLWSQFKADLFGYRCPLCKCKDLEATVQRPYLPKPICKGCAIDIGWFAERNETSDPLLKRLLTWTNLSFEEFRSLENRDMRERILLNTVWSRKN